MSNFLSEINFLYHLNLIKLLLIQLQTKLSLEITQNFPIIYSFISYEKKLYNNHTKQIHFISFYELHKQYFFTSFRFFHRVTRKAFFFCSGKIWAWIFPPLPKFFPLLSRTFFYPRRLSFPSPLPFLDLLVQVHTEIDVQPFTLNLLCFDYILNLCLIFFSSF